jgi:hypothetical protein
MNTAHPPAEPPTSTSKIRKGAIINGFINALINGAIQAWTLSGETSVPLSVDGITNDEHTVFGAAVPLAVSLAMILTGISYLSIPTPRPRFFPRFVGLVLKHGFFVFGVIVSFAVLWQRFLGSIPVSAPVAVAILAVIAGVVSGLINFMTLQAGQDSPRLTA